MAANAGVAVPVERVSRTPARLVALKVRASALLAELASLDMRSLEQLEAEELSRTLTPKLQTWLEQALAIMEDVVSADEKERVDPFADRTSMTFELRIDSLMVVGSAANTVVTDIAFVAGLELSQRLRQTAGLSPAAGQLELLSQCDSALRRIRKSLSALERAIANLEGCLPTAAYSSELSVSLRVRAAYGKLRTVLLAEGEPASGTLLRRMRAAGIQIAKLIGRDIYPELRIRDRMQIRQLQARILDWLRQEDPRDELLGMRLWKDIDAFVRLLDLVNKRQELVAHDTQLLAELAIRLSSTPLEPGVLADLERLRGLDEELDAMLDNCDAIEPSYWHDLVLRLNGLFGRASPPDWS